MTGQGKCMRFAKKKNNGRKHGLKCRPFGSHDGLKKNCHWTLHIIKTNTPAKLGQPSMYCVHGCKSNLWYHYYFFQSIQEDCAKHRNAMCRNTPGSFRCECKPGFDGQFKECQDVNECTSNKHKCSPHADCTNNVGSYKCSCKKGFHGDGRNCKDIKECEERVVRMHLCFARE